MTTKNKNVFAFIGEVRDFSPFPDNACLVFPGQLGVLKLKLQGL